MSLLGIHVSDSYMAPLMLPYHPPSLFPPLPLPLLTFNHNAFYNEWLSLRPILIAPSLKRTLGRGEFYFATRVNRILG